MVYEVQDRNDLTNQLNGAGNKLVIIDFHATWCSACRFISPKLRDIEAQNHEKLIILKVDIDQCKDLATEFKIKTMPTFVFMKNGNKLDSFSGADYNKLKEKAAKLAQ